MSINNLNIIFGIWTAAAIKWEILFYEVADHQINDKKNLPTYASMCPVPLITSLNKKITSEHILRLVTICAKASQTGLKFSERCSLLNLQKFLLLLAHKNNEKLTDVSAFVNCKSNAGRPVKHVIR